MTVARHLFVGGNARSGTTALVQLLNCHREVFVLSERYLAEFLGGRLTAAHYARDAVLADPRGLPDAGPGDDLAGRFDAARLIGDKFPALSAGFDLLDREFPGAALVYILRNPFSVAESYQARFDAGSWKRDARKGIEQWNDSVRLGLKRAEAGKPLTVLPYEGLFRSEALIGRLFESLGLDYAGIDRARVQAIMAKARGLADAPGPRNEDLRHLVSMTAAFRPYRELIERFGLRANDVSRDMAEFAAASNG